MNIPPQPFRSLPFPLLAILFFTIAIAGCAGPIGVTRISPQDSYNLSIENAMNRGKLSDNTKTVLQRYNLLDSLAEDPDNTLQTLHKISGVDDRRDILFALSEVSYFWASRLTVDYSNDHRRQARDLFLQAAVYSYFYLLDDEREKPPTAYDYRLGQAGDLYNRSLWQAFPINANGSINFIGGARTLPGGVLPLTLNTEFLAWSYVQLDGLFPADAYAVRGFTVRNRTPGLGLPLIGLTGVSNESPNGGALPITAFLRIPGSYQDFLEGRSRAVLEFYSALDDSEVEVNAHQVPLMTDITAPLAYKLEGSRLWNIGLKDFFTGSDVAARVLLVQPYEPGRIPVVFVHGTASSPAWWAEMLNSLRADPVIRKKFQFWFYQYNSNNPIVFSAADLRDSLTALVGRFDPQQQDPALQRMVVIGHSQGGLLTKMTVVDPGDDLWNAVSDKPLDQFQVDEQIKDVARRAIMFHPLPFIKRVIFISTPHRGSFLTKGWVRSLTRSIVSLPLNILSKSKDLFSSMGTQLKLPASIKGQIPTSIDSMSSENPLLGKLAALPLVPGVTGHSIIAVKPGMDIATGDDGVVAYQSAHLDGLKSEFILRADHSCQGHPFAIEEVRRILLEHIGIDNAWRPPAELLPTATP